MSSFPHLSICLLFFSSLAWAFICCTSMVSGLRLRMYRSWFPMHNARMPCAAPKPWMGSEDTPVRMQMAETGIEWNFR
ncbi:hypothetical protein EYF80_041992 [Liparis tanakae]|uniref:Secreted protein n=1 Tax=Liparis tanakae TaxID=230148 RepID=A0A4Z2G411_9TELE|nr:hypothetical protein EYF80_041992 [Liparis tanakae]